MKIKYTLMAGMCGLALFFSGGATQAAPVVILNNSFENQTGGGATVTDWVEENGGGFTFSSPGGGGLPTATDGSRWLNLDSRDNGGGTTSGAHQNVGTVQADTLYTFTFDVGKRNINIQDFTIGLFASAGATPTTALTTISRSDLTIPITGSTLDTESFNITFNTNTNSAFNGQNLFIRAFGTEIVTAPPAPQVEQVLFDNFQLDATAIPEPSTYALLGLGAGALYFLRRKKRA